MITYARVIGDGWGMTLVMALLMALETAWTVLWGIGNVGIEDAYFC